MHKKNHHILTILILQPFINKHKAKIYDHRTYTLIVIKNVISQI